MIEMIDSLTCLHMHACLYMTKYM